MRRNIIKGAAVGLTLGAGFTGAMVGLETLYDPKSGEMRTLRACVADIGRTTLNTGDILADCQDFKKDFHTTVVQGPADTQIPDAKVSIVYSFTEPQTFLRNETPYAQSVDGSHERRGAPVTLVLAALGAVVGAGLGSFIPEESAMQPSLAAAS